MALEVPEHVGRYLASRTVEDGDCLVWQLACNSGGCPVATIDMRRSQPVRRWLFQQLHGRLRRGRVVITSCETPACVAPHHLQGVQPSEVNRRIAARGHRWTVRAIQAAQRNGRRNSPLSIDDVHTIRQRRFQAGETISAIAAAYPVSASTISRICRSESWRETGPVADPFAQLKAVCRRVD